MGWFGASVKRKEDPAFLTGGGRYVDDIKLAGMLHAAVLRSPHAHAAIHGIDKRAALALPGVQAVFTHSDLPDAMRRQTVPLLVPSPTIKQPFMPYCLAKDEVCFVGEPIAIVVAENRYIAEDAAGLVAVDFEPLPAVSDCAKGLAAGAAPAHRGSPNNLAAFIPINVGNTDAAFGQAAHIFRERIFQHRGEIGRASCRERGG